MKSIKKRLLSLAIGEFAAVCAFILVYLSYNLRTLGIANLIAFSYLIFILIQGSAYWFYKYRLLVKRAHPSFKTIKFLSYLRWLNLILALFIMIAIPITRNSYKELLIATGFISFGILEYINYYWYRLSYGASGFNVKVLMNKGLKKSSISKTISK